MRTNKTAKIIKQITMATFTRKWKTLSSRWIFLIDVDDVITRMFFGWLKGIVSSV